MPAATTKAPPSPISILFVCLGNICRSPMAEAVFLNLLKSQPDLKPLIKNVDSAGTCAAHIESDPDTRTTWTLQEKGITEYTHYSRQVIDDDFIRFDYLIAMDQSNLQNLRRMKRKVQKNADRAVLGEVVIFGDFGGQTGEEIDDPWYGGQEGFTTVYEQCVRFSKGFATQVLGWNERTEEADTGHLALSVAS